MTSVWIHQLSVWSPIVASVTVLATLITCFIITQVNDVYTGGLVWPFFSVMGRDIPAYYVFSTGLSIVALSLCTTWYCNRQFQKAALRMPIFDGHVSPLIQWVSIACMVLGIISTPGLPVLAFFSTTSYPSLHNNAAYWFFLIETVAIFINTFVSYMIMKTTSARNQLQLVSVRKTFTIQIVFASIFFVAFLLYLPVGLALVKPSVRLTISECLERNLGVHYCTVTMKYDDTYTKLWNYENDFTATQIRAGAQLGCILMLVGYSTSFLTHHYEKQESGKEESVVLDAGSSFVSNV